MPPKKNKDKGKGIAQDPKPQTPFKAPQQPNTEKILASAIPVKSWIKMVEEEGLEYKAPSPEPQVNEQVKEWIQSISQNPELLLALQSTSQKDFKAKEISKAFSDTKSVSKAVIPQEFSSQNVILSGEATSSQVVVSQPTFSKKTSDWFNKPHTQNVLTMEDGIYHSDPFKAISNIFPKDWYFKPWDLQKPQSFYQDILEITESVKFKHFFLSSTHKEPAYSTATILKVISPNQWGDQLHKHRSFPLHFRTTLTHALSFSYWDYQQAWFNTFYLQNHKHSHSWLFFFNSKITVSSLPNWFSQWWDYFGPIPEILTPNAQSCLNLFKAHYVPPDSEKRFPPFLCFCTKFFLPWVWMWTFRFHEHFLTQSSNSSKPISNLILQRTFRVKWWSKFDEKSKLSEHIVTSWLSVRGCFKPDPIAHRLHHDFLAQKSKAQSLLASAKTEDEYFKIMEQLFKSRSSQHSQAASSSSSSNSKDLGEDPLISLGEDDEENFFSSFTPLSLKKK